MKRTCTECGAPVHALSKEPLCKEHNKTRREAAKGSNAAAGKVAKRKPGRPAKVAAVTEAERTVASLLVSEQQIDRMFLKWPLEDKVLAVQSFLDRESA